MKHPPTQKPEWTLTIGLVNNGNIDPSGGSGQRDRAGEDIKNGSVYIN